MLDPRSSLPSTHRPAVTFLSISKHCSQATVWNQRTPSLFSLEVFDSMAIKFIDDNKPACSKGGKKYAASRAHTALPASKQCCARAVRCALRRHAIFEHSIPVFWSGLSKIGQGGDPGIVTREKPGPPWRPGRPGARGAGRWSAPPGPLPTLDDGKGASALSTLPLSQGVGGGNGDAL